MHLFPGNGDVIHKTAQGVLKQPLREVAGENPFLKDNSMDEHQRSAANHRQMGGGGGGLDRGVWRMEIIYSPPYWKTY